MNEIDQKPSKLADMTTSQPESTDPDYQAWVKAEIEAALAKDIAHPENRIPARDIWKKHGLES